MTKCTKNQNFDRCFDSNLDCTADFWSVQSKIVDRSKWQKSNPIFKFSKIWNSEIFGPRFHLANLRFFTLNKLALTVSIKKLFTVHTVLNCPHLFNIYYRLIKTYHGIWWINLRDVTESDHVQYHNIILSCGNKSCLLCRLITIIAASRSASPPLLRQ